MLSQCSKCGLSKSTGPMGSVLPQCQCDWKMPNSQRTWVGLTDEEYTHITDTVFHTGQGLVAYYKAIEAKLKEKNNAA